MDDKQDGKSFHHYPRFLGQKLKNNKDTFRLRQLDFQGLNFDFLMDAEKLSNAKKSVKTLRGEK